MNREISQPQIPDSLKVELRADQQDVVLQWWSGLTETERSEFINIATLNPDQLSNRIPLESADMQDEGTNQWFEYLVNQDVRIYFDRSDVKGHPGSHMLVYPIMSPISAAANIEVISHLLTSRIDGKRID